MPIDRTARGPERPDSAHGFREPSIQVRARPSGGLYGRKGLRGQPKKMADGARLVCDFEPPFGMVAEPRDGIGDEVRADPGGLLSGGPVIQQLDREFA